MNMEEKKSGRKTKKKSVSPKIKRVDKEFYWITGVMVGLILVFLVSYSVFQTLRTFEYEGLSFTKEKLGDIDFYRHYYYTDLGVITGLAIDRGTPHQINLYLQSDPRENDIPVDGDVKFDLQRPVFISTNTTGLTQCDGASAGLSTLSIFLNANGLDITGGTTDRALANESGVEYVTCEDRPLEGSVVILIREGDETSIQATDKSCYVIKANNCEILPAIEKFIVQMIIDARAEQN